jgi:hypothetical protein
LVHRSGHIGTISWFFRAFGAKDKGNAVGECVCLSRTLLISEFG